MSIRYGVGKPLNHTTGGHLLAFPFKKLPKTFLFKLCAAASMCFMTFYHLKDWIHTEYYYWDVFKNDVIYAFTQRTELLRRKREFDTVILS